MLGLIRVEIIKAKCLKIHKKIFEVKPIVDMVSIFSNNDNISEAGLHAEGNADESFSKDKHM